MKTHKYIKDGFRVGEYSIYEVMQVESSGPELTQDECHEQGLPCDESGCQECCPHDERDHGICLDCEHEQDPGEAIDAAMDYFEDR